MGQQTNQASDKLTNLTSNQPAHQQATHRFGKTTSEVAIMLV